MELKTINIDGEDIEVAIKLDPEYYEENFDLEDTMELDLNELKEGEDNEKPE